MLLDLDFKRNNFVLL